MLTEKDYCDYDTCVTLEELGYPRYHYDNGGELDKILRMVTLYNAQKWLREVKRIGVFVSGFKNGYTFWVNNILNGDTLYQGFFDKQTGEKYKSYEDALSEGIKEAVKILKENETIHE